MHMLATKEEIEALKQEEARMTATTEIEERFEITIEQNGKARSTDSHENRTRGGSRQASQESTS